MNSDQVTSAGSWILRIGFIRSYWEQMRLTWRLFRDPREPILLKAIPILTIVYLVSPVDWLVNLIPVLGQMEDIAVLGLGMTFFIRLSPPELVDHHRAEIRGVVPPQITAQSQD